MTITNTVKVSTITVPFVADVSSRLPVCLNSNHDFNKTFVGGHGSTMNISVPDFGTVATGPTLSDAQLSYVGASRSLTLSQTNAGIALTAPNMSVDFSNLNTQVKDSYSAYFASQIQQPVIKSLVYGACSATLCTSGKEFNDYSYGIAAVRKSRSAGTVVGAFDPMANSKLVSSGISFYNPSSQISEMFKQGAVGRFGEAETFTTPDFTTYTWVDSAVKGAGTTIKGAITFSSDYAKTVVVTVAGGTATLTGTVQAGTPFTIAGLNKTDIYGNDTGIPFVFINQTTGTIGSDTVTLTVQDLYASGPNKNINTAANVSATALTWMLTTAKIYAVGVVYDKATLAFGEAELQPIMGAESEAFTDPDGITICASIGADIKSGFGILRLDNLSGSTLVRGIWAHAFYFALN